MDYIQHRLYKAIEKTRKRQAGKESTIVGYYNVLIQYQLYLMFACVWDKREPELARTKRMEYLSAMKRATLGTILNVIMELDSLGPPILGVDRKFYARVMEFIKPRNAETAHGILIPGVQEDGYQELAVKYEAIHNAIRAMDIPILKEDCRLYYMPGDGSYQVVVFDNEDYDYQDLNEQLVKALDLQPGELHYYFGNVCYKISPFLILRENPNREEPYEIYCYQEYNLKNGKFEYKRYSELDQNISYAKICKDYFLSFQEEFSHTISKANGVICNKFENNYDYFISTSPFDSYEQKVWQFLKKGKSNACLTIRGGGGIGKTALIQYVCTKNIFEPFEAGSFQYVIFCSAKDREFKQTSGLIGHIKSIQDESIVRCYEDIIRTIGWVLDVETELKTEEDIKAVEDIFVHTSGILLIVDDFETLSEEDKKKVIAFSARLDVMKHKMVITTRSQYMAGEEYYIEGLDCGQTIGFMRERFKQGCTESQCGAFEQLIQEKGIKKKIYELTKGLPMLAIQLGNILVLNDFHENALIKREDEEVEDFLLGRLYSYFGTKTSKILFLIAANFFQYGRERILHDDLRTIYLLICERLKIAVVDYEQDLNELKKLHIILVEADDIKISNFISNNIIRQCEDALIAEADIDFTVFDNLLFKSVIELGMKDGILAYCEKENALVDDAFIKVFVFDNLVKYTNDIRFSILEKFVLKNLNDHNKLRDLYRESCKFFEIASVDSKYVFWGRKYGFILPELADKRDVSVDEAEISAEYYLQEIIHELEEQRDAIDDFLIARKKGASQSFCLDTMQNIRGSLGSICNVKLVKIFSLKLEGCTARLQEMKDLMDEISYTREFSMKENEPYVRLEELLKETK